ncbi:unnamed protein product [Strongylus vulgaris]|uniref:PB1 domain-containing protein n=1 Tax=Strongylus vulgaris TaxID=40348 RepID=A0A3P7JE59_STRVU|nr:unnamed protein product [Strongylus vulgaris]
MLEISVKLRYAGAYRRFRIKGDNSESLFTDLMSHIAHIAENTTSFDVAWQDEDGDSIVISRPAELDEAIDLRREDVLRLHAVGDIGSSTSTSTLQNSEVEKEEKIGNFETKRSESPRSIPRRSPESKFGRNERRTKIEKRKMRFSPIRYRVSNMNMFLPKDGQRRCFYQEYDHLTSSVANHHGDIRRSAEDTREAKG